MTVITTGGGMYVLPDAPQVRGLDAATQDTLNGLFQQWAAKMPRNIERTVYLEGKNRLKDLRVAIPPHMRDELEVVLEWPEKAVYFLGNRIAWDGVTSPDGSNNPFGLRDSLRENRFGLEIQQAIIGSLAHSVSFVSTTPGRVGEGEPPALVMMHSALWATGLWSRPKRALTSGLLINDTDNLGRPTRLTILTPFEAVVCVKGAKGQWYVDDVRRHGLGRVPLEPLPFRPTLDRPFGRSRINRPVMSLTDRAVRAGCRMEVHSEFFSALKLLLLGVEDDAFKDQNGKQVPLWDWYMGRFNTLTKDDDGDFPKLEKISAESPEPHIAIKRQLAAEFSGATGVPLGSLGIQTDNPSSAQAMNEVREETIIEASVAGATYSEYLHRVYENVVMIRDGLDAPPAGMADVMTKLKNPARPSVVSQSDAIIKQVSAIPWLAESAVTLEELGYSDAQVTRLLADKRRAQAPAALAALVGAGGGVDEESGAEAEAAEIKAKADAMGVLIRAGVKPEDAAARVGLPGIQFTGAVPVALRMPEDKATSLEER